MANEDVFELIYCVPATIRKCDGFVIEAESNKHMKSEVLEALKILQAKGYKTHGLGHTENDKYEPKEIFRGSVQGPNKFGWFVTKGTMDFPSNELKSCVQLSSRNKKYYKLEEKVKYGKIPMKCEYFAQGEKLKVSEMVNGSEIMRQINFVTSGLEVIKELRTRFRHTK